MATEDPRERISQEAYDRRVEEALSVARNDPMVKNVKYNDDKDWVMVELKSGGQPPHIEKRLGNGPSDLFEDISEETSGFETLNKAKVQTGVDPETDKPLYGTEFQHFRLYRIRFQNAGTGERVGQSKNVHCDPENNPNIK